MPLYQYKYPWATIACQLITDIQIDSIIIYFCIPHIASDINMTILNLTEVPVLMLLFYNNTKDIAIVQFKFLVFYIKSMMIKIGISYFYSVKRYHFRDIVLFYDSWCNNKIKEKFVFVYVLQSLWPWLTHTSISLLV